MPLEIKILSLEQVRLGAMLSSDVRALTNLFGESLLYVQSSGLSDSSGSCLSMLETGDAPASICTDHMHASLLHEGSQAEVRGRYLACCVGTANGCRLLAVHWAAS